MNIRKQSAVVIFLTSWISKAEKFSIPNLNYAIWVLSCISKQIERKMIVWTFALSFIPLQLLVLKSLFISNSMELLYVTICNCNLQVCYCTCNLSWISLVLQFNKRIRLSHNHPSVRSTHQPKPCG